MNLHEVNRGIHKHKKLTRVARGPGSGLGKTAGRGGKGQTARAGYKALSIFQGGMTPLVRRVPKRGFTNSFALTVGAVNLSDIEREFNAGDEVNSDTLKSKGLVARRVDVVKVLGDGDLSKKVRICVHRVSSTAKEKIEKAGCELVLVRYRIPVSEKNAAAKQKE